MHSYDRTSSREYCNRRLAFTTQCRRLEAKFVVQNSDILLVEPKLYSTQRNYMCVEWCSEQTQSHTTHYECPYR